MAIKGFSVSTLLSILLMALPLSARINFVQQNNTTSNPSGLSTRVAFRAVQGAGNLNVVVVGWNDQSAAYADVRVVEYAGLDPTSPRDVTSAAVGNSRNGSSGPAATKALGQLIFGACLYQR